MLIMEGMKKMCQKGISFIGGASADPGALRMPDRDASLYKGGWPCMSIMEVHQ